jgi:subtilase family serine protease
MRTSRIAFFTLFSISCLLTSALAQTGLPYPNAETPNAVDRGAVTATSATTPITFTIALGLPNLEQAESLLNSVYTPGDRQFHQFLTAQQFAARFAPSNASVAKVIAGLARYGLVAQRTTTTTLSVTGLPVNVQRAFAVNLHNYEVAGHGNVRSYTFHAPVNPATIPAELSGSVAAVVGLDSRPRFHPLHVSVPHAVSDARVAPAAGTGNVPGLWTVTDFANYYDVQPLYTAGVSGSGRTVGIMTLAAFTPSDAFAYWKAVGLSVDPNRIHIVNVDGGPGAPSDASGSDETSLDVEQSGGIAPGAKVMVYQAPNTNQGFVDLFATAVDSNSADSLSISWGSWEWLSNLENSPVKDPITHRTVGETQAVHELLVRAALQGQSVFAASGDGGAYDVNHDLGCTSYSSSDPFSCSLTLSVDYPASDPAITAAGGTTLPGLQEYCLNAGCTPPYYDVNIQHESVWGWDYLVGLCNTLGLDPVSCGIFPAGGGGGVSVAFDEPLYQFFLSGVQRSQPGQVFQAGAGWAQYGIGLHYALPSRFPGRNVPDISFNADPDTGYIIYYTSSVSGPEVLSFYGGTSFVAPQLNGVTALLGQYVRNKRIGLLNFPLYDLAITGQAYRGAHAPLNAIAYGDNWFYHGSNGYNPGAGLGTMDVANFAKVLHGLFFF